MGGNVEYLARQKVPEGYRVYRSENVKYFYISGNEEVPSYMSGYIEIDYEERKKLMEKPKPNTLEKFLKKVHES